MKVSPKVKGKYDIKSTFSSERYNLSQEYLQILGKVLNKFHNTNLTEVFWNTVLRDYVSFVISNLEFYEREFCELPITNVVHNGFGKPTVRQVIQRELVSLVKVIKTDKERKTFFKILESKNDLHIGFPDLEIVNSDLGDSLPIFYPMLYFLRNNRQRKKLAALAELEENIVVKNMILGLPKVFVEGFKSTILDFPLFDPPLKHLHFHIGPSYMQWISAWYKENGAHLTWYQHGAFYGEIEFGGEVWERQFADRYRTWGWQQHPKDEPWKAYRLIAFKKEYDKVTLPEPEFDLLICMPNILPSNKKERSEKISKFIERLDRKIFKRIMIRYRPMGKANSKRSLLEISLPNIEFSIGDTTIYEDMKNARLVIQFKIPATNFMECLFVQKPCIAINGNKNPTDYVLPFYGDLYELGVLYDSFEEIAEFLNNNDIQNWHSQVTGSEKYGNFLRYFCGK